jgi:hypothetical protein
MEAHAPFPRKSFGNSCLSSILNNGGDGLNQWGHSMARRLPFGSDAYRPPKKSHGAPASAARQYRDTKSYAFSGGIWQD